MRSHPPSAKQAFVFATNAVAATPLSVVAINQTDASRQFSTQPFAAVGSPQSWSLSAITIDPLRSRIFTADSLAGEVAALELRDDGLHDVWTAQQRTSEFLALIDQAQRRVLVGTDVPPGETIGANTHDARRVADGGCAALRHQQWIAIHVAEGAAGRAAGCVLNRVPLGS